MYDTILVPTDGSDHAQRAAEHALSLAESFDATVHVLNVTDVRARAGPFDVGGVDDEYVARLEDAGAAAIDAVEALAGDSQRIRAAVSQGDPEEEILEYADEYAVELLVMGTHGRTGVDRYVAGSVTEGVVRQAEVPVLTVRATERSNLADGYDEILIPSDGSEYAESAVDHGLAIARQYDARVHAVSVVDLGAISTNAEYSAPMNVIERFRSRAETITEEIETRAQDAGLETVTSVREGFPAADLLDYADETDVDLIGMGTAGRTGLSRFLLGSTTERLIRHADVPVLAVNARDDGD